MNEPNMNEPNNNNKNEQRKSLSSDLKNALTDSNSNNSENEFFSPNLLSVCFVYVCLCVFLIHVCLFSIHTRSCLFVFFSRLQ